MPDRDAGSGSLLRHSLVTLDPGVALRVARDALERDRARIEAWISARLPLVVRVQRHQLPAQGRVALGLPLPPKEGKRRLAFELERDCIIAVSPPPRLRETLAALSAPWRDALRELDAAATRIGLEFRVFGSIAWQALTGMEYVSAGSDVDLLWAPRDSRELTAGLDLLVRWQRSSGLPADGEILFGEHAVSWREWQQGDARVIGKSIAGPSLCARAELLARLSARA
jgi:phosphoribosyl-dephospho-CoA transferase